MSFSFKKRAEDHVRTERNVQRAVAVVSVLLALIVSAYLDIEIPRCVIVWIPTVLVAVVVSSILLHFYYPLLCPECGERLTKHAADGEPISFECAHCGFLHETKIIAPRSDPTDYRW